MAAELMHENIWMNKCNYDDAERQHYECLAKLPNDSKGCVKDTDSTKPVFFPMNSCVEENVCPKTFVALKKVHSSDSESSKEIICPKNLSSPNISTPNVTKKTKSQKNAAEKEDSEWGTCWTTKSELKEKSSKKNKKTKEANRLRELMNNSVSNKDLSPPSAKEDSIGSPVHVDTLCKAQKNKEKLSKSEKKRANKKEKADAIKVEEIPLLKNNVNIKKNCDQGGAGSTEIVSNQCSLASEVAKARQHIKNSLECMDSVLATVPSVEVVTRIDNLEKALADLRNLTISLQKEVKDLQQQIASKAAPAIAVCPARPSCPTPAKAPAKESVKEDSDDGVDLFASDSDGEDDAAAAKIKEERLAAYAAKKSSKPVLIAKSSIILDVKPWDDTTNMEDIEKLVRKIETDGLLWGASKLVPLAFGIKKLQMCCVVEDEKVSIDWLQEEIEKYNELVQSVDIAAFNKI